MFPNLRGDKDGGVKSIRRVPAWEAIGEWFSLSKPSAGKFKVGRGKDDETVRLITMTSADLTIGCSC